MSRKQSCAYLASIYLVCMLRWREGYALPHKRKISSFSFVSIKSWNFHRSTNVLEWRATAKVTTSRQQPYICIVTSFHKQKAFSSSSNSIGKNTCLQRTTSQVQKRLSCHVVYQEVNRWFTDFFFQIWNQIRPKMSGDKFSNNLFELNCRVSFVSFCLFFVQLTWKAPIFFSNFLIKKYCHTTQVLDRSVTHKFPWMYICSFLGLSSCYTWVRSS